MRTSRLRLALVGLALVMLAGATGCGESERTPIRIGVLVDCTGVLAETHDWTLAATELALLQHGGRLAGNGPAGGVQGATVAGRRVEMVEGCAEAGVYGRMITEARRLVEVDHVDAVIGGLGWADGVVFREIARRYPSVPFLLVGTDVREPTLRAPAANLYRFTPDVEQLHAGLATYAYQTLGWRRAATVAEDQPNGWGAVASFVAEFCALGGSVERIWTPVFAEGPPLLRQVPPSVDGVALFSNYGLGNPASFIRAYLARDPDAAHKLLLGLWTYSPFEVPLYAPLWPRLRGVVASLAGVPDPSSATDTAYRKAFAAAFPGLPPSVAGNLSVRPYYDAMEAVLQATEMSRGDLGAERARLHSALASVRLATPAGPVRLDGNRQAVVPVTLVRLDGTAPGAASFHAVRRIPEVDQTIGGLLDASLSPSRATPACRRSAPPPWTH